RMSATLEGITTGYLLDGVNVVGEQQGGSPEASILDGPLVNQSFTFNTQQGQSSLLTDGAGSTVAVADGSGTVRTQYTYDPFGATSSSGAQSENPMQYLGMQDDWIGQYFDHARYFSPGIDRFTSQDP